MTPGEAVIKCCCQMAQSGNLPPTGGCVTDGNAPSCEFRVPLTGEPHDYVTVPKYLILELPLVFDGYGPLANSPAWHTFVLQYRSDYLGGDTIEGGYMRMPLWNPLSNGACPRTWSAYYDQTQQQCPLRPPTFDTSTYVFDLEPPSCSNFKQLRGAMQTSGQHVVWPGIPCIVPREGEPNGYVICPFPTYFRDPDPGYDPGFYCLTTPEMPWDYPNPMTWIWSGSKYTPPPFGGSTIVPDAIAGCTAYPRICPGPTAPEFYCVSYLHLDDSMEKTGGIGDCLYYEAMS